VDHGELAENEPNSTLDCQSCGREYPVENGIPVMLVTENEEKTDD
jgi:uncharacterized protein YbaR (Trm112 family)